MKKKKLPEGLLKGKILDQIVWSYTEEDLQKVIKEHEAREKRYQEYLSSKSNKKSPGLMLPFIFGDLLRAKMIYDLIYQDLKPFKERKNKSLGGHAEKGKKENLKTFKKVRKANPDANAKKLVELCNKAGLKIGPSSVYTYLKEIGE